MTFELTAEIVRELLDYNIETGVLRWRIRDVRWFNSSTFSAKRACNRWNACYAGKIAGTPSGKGYLVVQIFGKLYRAHRLAWLLVTGAWPDNFVDHKNGNRDDNRWENLRSVTEAENQKNRGMNSNNSSGFKGVSWNKNSRKWQVFIKVGGKNRNLGQFETPEKGHAAYALAAVNLGFTDRHVGRRTV